MKKSYSILIIFPFLIACGGEEVVDVESIEQEETTQEVIIEEEIVNSLLLESKSVGLFSIGQEVPNLPVELHIRQFLESDEEGEELTHNVIFNELEDVVELIMDHQMEDQYHEDKNIEEMIVLSNYYETKEGIKVGSTLEEFIEIHNDAKVWYTNITKRYILETEALEGVQFILSSDDCTKKINGNREVEKLNLHDFVYGAEIIQIRVY